MNARPRVLAYAAIVVAVTALAVAWRYRGATPVGGEAAPDRFSAARARGILERLLAEGRPHPVGSPANEAVRDRVLATLEAIGYRPATQSFKSCPSACVEGTNIVAELVGKDAESAVVLSAHYDSAAGGPGASDDGSGVAIALEVARLLKREPTPAHSVIFLFSDGEEAGLLGADAFLTENPAAHRAKVVVNLEARGTSGPSLMFETSGDSARLVPVFARAVERPVTSSLFASVYQRMPNDTDLSAFRRHGVDGFNFAFVGDAQNYHGRTDDLTRLSDASLQHQGDNALALVRQLSARRDEGKGSGESVYFDVLARWVIHWPVARSPILLGACVALLAAALAILWLTRADAANLGRALLVWPVALGLALALGLGMERVLGARTSLATIWPDRFALPLAAVALAAIAAGVGAIALAGRAVTPLTLCVGSSLGWALIALGAMIAVPGSEYVALIPCLASGVEAVALATVSGFSGRRRTSFAATVSEWIVALAIVPQALVLLPIYRLLYPALGLYSVMLLVVAFTPGVLVVAPALSSVGVRGRVLTAVCAGLASAGVCALSRLG